MIIDVNLLPNTTYSVNYFKKNEKGCKVYSYDEKVSERNDVIEITLEDFEIENDFCVDGKTFEMLKVLSPIDDIKITEKNFIIKSKKGKYTGRLLNENFFSLDIDENCTSLQVDINDLMKASKFVAKTDKKPALCGVRVDSNCNILATDSFKAYFKIENELTDDGVILPLSFINFAKTLFDFEGKTEIKYSNNVVSIEKGNIRLYSRLISNTYPDMKRIYAKHLDLQGIKINKQDLIEKISIAQKIGTTDLFKIAELNTNKFEISGINAYETEIDFPKDNDYKVRMDVNYLDQALKSIEQEDVEFRISYSDEEKIALMIFILNNSKEVCLILGVRR